MTIEDKYKRTLHEIEALKDHLANRKELARRAQSHSEEWKSRMRGAEDELTQQKIDQKDVTSGKEQQTCLMV